MDKISAAHNTSQAAIALAWLLAKPDIGAPIASATSLSQLDTLFAATQVKLSADDVKVLDEVSK